MIYYAFCAVFGMTALLLDSRLYKLLALGILGVVGIGLLWWVGSRE
jgi:hypothetical protein